MNTQHARGTARWRRAVLALAGTALASLLGALSLTLWSFMTRPGTLTFLLLLACLAIGVLASVALAAGLLADPTARAVERRLAAIEARLEALDGVSRDAVPAAPQPADTVAPSPAEPERAIPTLPVPPAQEPPAPRPPAPPADATPPEPPAGGEGWELALGRRWLGRIGAAVLVAAVALLLKLGWDQGWLRPSETVRVTLGLLIGGVLFAAGEFTRRRRGYGPQAQALGAAGFGAVILSIWAAATPYRLLEPAVGLLLFLLAAALIAAYAVAVSGEPLAVLALAAGFAAPHLVPTASWDVSRGLGIAGAFAAAALAASLLRRWRFLPWIAAAGTALDLAPILEIGRHAANQRIAWAGGILAVALVHLAAASAAARHPAGERGVRSSLAATAVGIFVAWGAGAILLEAVSSRAVACWAAGILLLLALAGVLARKAPSGATLAAALGLAAWLPAVTLPGLLLDGTAVGLAWAAMALGAGLLGLRLGSEGWLFAASSLAVLSAVQPFAAAEAPSGAGALRLLALATILTGLLAAVERAAGGTVSRATALLRAIAGPAAAAGFTGLAFVTAHHLADTMVFGAGGRAVEGSIRLAILLAGGTIVALAAAGTALVTTRIAAAALLAAGLLPHAAIPPGAWPAAFLPDGRLLLAALAGTLLAWAASADGATRWRRWLAALAAAGAVWLAFPMARTPSWLGRSPLAAVHPLVIAAAGGALLAAGRVARRWRDAGRYPGWLENSGWFVLVMAVSRAATVLVPSGPVLSIVWGLAGLALLGHGLATNSASRRHLGLILLGLTVGRIVFRDLAGAGTVVRVVAFGITGCVLIAGSFLYARFREMFTPEGAAAPTAGNDGNGDDW